MIFRTGHIATFLGLGSGILFLPIEIKVIGLVLRPFDFVLFLAIPFVFLLFNKTKHTKAFFSNGAVLLVLLLFGYQMVNAFFLNPGSLLKEGIQNFEFILITYFVCAFATDEKTFNKYFQGFYIAIFAIVLYAFLWHIAHGYFVRYKNLNEPKYLFGLLALMLFAKTFINQRFLPFLTIAIVLLLFSLERKAWFSFLFAFLFLLYANYAKLKLKQKVMKIVAPMSVLLFIAFFAGLTFASTQSSMLTEQFDKTTTLVQNFSLEERDASVTGSASNEARLYLLYFAVKSFQNNPWFGIGTENFKPAIERFSLRESGRPHGAHNEYQRILVENGLVGLVIYLLAYFITIRKLMKINRKDILRSPQSHFAFLFILGLTVYGAVINLFLGGGATNKFFLVIPVGLMAGYVFQLKNNHREKNLKTSY